MIYILTVYDSLNYGSYLQAFALKEMLSKYGQVSFLDIKHQSTSKQTVEKVLAHIYKRRFKGVIFEIKKFNIFKKCKKDFVITNIDKINRNDMSNIYVFGSDEIWNISREKFLKSPEFWGENLDGFKISYAPSLNTATKDDYLKNKYLITLLNKFDFISVRDKNSYEALKDLTDKKIEMVLDPTFIYGVENFKTIEVKPNEKEKYLMIYTYGKMCKKVEEIEAIKRFAHDNGLKTISVGKYLKWCDKSVNVTPMEFLGYVHNAEYVLTDTFHGTVFSILYRKNFSVINPANKIKDLLTEFKLDKNAISDVIKLKEIKQTDYKLTEEIQKERVNRSIKYLENAVLAAKKEVSE